MVRGLLSSSDRVCSVTTVTPRAVPSSRVPELARRRLALYTRECQRSRAAGAECPRVAPGAPCCHRRPLGPGRPSGRPRPPGNDGRRPAPRPPMSRARPQPRRPNRDHSYPGDARSATPPGSGPFTAHSPATVLALRAGRTPPSWHNSGAAGLGPPPPPTSGGRSTGGVAGPAARPDGRGSPVFDERSRPPVCYVRITETERVTIR